MRHRMRAALVGLLASFWMTAAAGQDAAMTFRVVPAQNCRSCAPEILAVGFITLESPDEFRAAAGKIGGAVVVRLASPGGNLVGGLRLGQAVRELGAATTVARGSRCVSACAYAFLGGP